MLYTYRKYMARKIGQQASSEHSWYLEYDVATGWSLFLFILLGGKWKEKIHHIICEKRDSGRVQNNPFTNLRWEWWLKRLYKIWICQRNLEIELVWCSIPWYFLLPSIKTPWGPSEMNCIQTLQRKVSRHYNSSQIDPVTLSVQNGI